MHHMDISDTVSRGPVRDSEPAQLVGLCANQIKAAVDEALREVDSLSRAVLDTVRHASAVQDSLGDHRPGARAVPDQPGRHVQALKKTAQEASMRLQFADRLAQRLSNVSTNLDGLARLMRSMQLPLDDSRWTAFLKATRTTFTMEQERRMFDAAFELSATVIDAGLDPGASQDPVLFDGDSGNEIE